MRRLPLSSQQRWWLLALGWVVLLGLGISGFIQQSDDLDLESTFLDHVYFTLQLAALNYKGESTAINWQLQVVRFAAPIMAAGTVLQSASVVFREQFMRFRARRSRRHTIVCGLDQVGTRLVEALADDGRELVAITTDANSAGHATATRLGVPVIVGDPADPGVLLAARADRASRVVATTDSDAVNVAIAASLRDVERASGAPALRCAVRLADGELAHLLRTTELNGTGDLRLEFFNVQERAAHALLAQHPVVGDGSTPPRLMLFGVGQFGGNVLVTAAQQWLDTQDGPLPVTLVDRQAHRRFHALAMQHPALRLRVDATCIDLDIGAPSETAVERFDDDIAAHPPSLVVVAFEDEALAWTSGLFVRRHLPGSAEIVVRTDSDGGFGRHLQTAVSDDERRATITSFPFLARACSVELIEGGVREQLARSIHEDHILRVGASDVGLRRDWDDLDDAERESSRRAADALVHRLNEIGARLAPLRHWSNDDEVLTADEIDRLAAAEHERWRSERTKDGWTWAATRDDALKHNPLLVEWASLPDDAQEYNLQAAAAIPRLLARAGFEIERLD